MMRQIRGLGRAAVIAAAIAWGAVGAAQAQQSETLKAEIRSLSEQVEHLRRDLSDTQRQVYGEDFVPREAPASPALSEGGGSANAAAARVAQSEGRIAEMQSHFEALTATAEEVQHQVDGLSARLDKLVADVYRRLAPLDRDLAARHAAGGQAAGGEASAGTASAEADLATATPQEVVPSADETMALPADESEAAGEASAVPGDAASTLLAGSAAEQYDYAFGLLARGEYDMAQGALVAFIAAHPDDPLSGNAQYWLGEAYYVREDFARAATAFLAGYQRYPDSAKAPDNLLKLAMTLGTLGQKADACATLDELVQRFPAAAETLRQRADRERASLACP